MPERNQSSATARVFEMSHSQEAKGRPPFTDVPGALEEFKAGRMVIVVDDEDRENEGDLTLAA